MDVWDGSTLQGYPPCTKFIQFYTWVDRDSARGKCLAQEINAMSLGGLGHLSEVIYLETTVPTLLTKYSKVPA